MVGHSRVGGLAGVRYRCRCLVGGWLADRLVGWLARSFIRSLSRSVWPSVALPRPCVGSSLGCFVGSLVCVGRCFLYRFRAPLVLRWHAGPRRWLVFAPPAREDARLLACSLGLLLIVRLAARFAR